MPDSEKDWHPRSNGQVLDLVHPSLYPVVYGRTLAYPENSIQRDPTKLAVIPPPQDSTASTGGQTRYAREKGYAVSQRFQWLPTDFQVSQDGKSVKSLGYINNLNPEEHAALRTTVEELVAAYLPLFERVLTDCIPKNDTIPQRVTNGYSYDEEYKPCPDDEDVEDEDEYDERYKEWEDNRPFEQPDVKSGGYVPGSLEQRRWWYALSGHTIQVIVKLANIHLVRRVSVYSDI